MLNTLKGATSLTQQTAASGESMDLFSLLGEMVKNPEFLAATPGHWVVLAVLGMIATPFLLYYGAKGLNAALQSVMSP